MYMCMYVCVCVCVYIYIYIYIYIIYINMQILQLIFLLLIKTLQAAPIRKMQKLLKSEILRSYRTGKINLKCYI